MTENDKYFSEREEKPEEVRNLPHFTGLPLFALKAFTSEQENIFWDFIRTHVRQFPLVKSWNVGSFGELSSGKARSVDPNKDIDDPEQQWRTFDVRIFETLLSQEEIADDETREVLLNAFWRSVSGAADVKIRSQKEIAASLVLKKVKDSVAEQGRNAVNFLSGIVKKEINSTTGCRSS